MGRAQPPPAEAPDEIPDHLIVLGKLSRQPLSAADVIGCRQGLDEAQRMTIDYADGYFMDAEDKRARVAESGRPLDQCIAIGDTVNDIPMFGETGKSFLVADQRTPEETLEKARQMGATIVWKDRPAAEIIETVLAELR